MNLLFAFVAAVCAMLFAKFHVMPFAGVAVFAGLAAICVSIEHATDHILESIHEAGRGVCSEIERQTDELMADEPEEATTERDRIEGKIRAFRRRLESELLLTGTDNAAATLALLLQLFEIVEADFHNAAEMPDEDTLTEGPTL